MNSNRPVRSQAPPMDARLDIELHGGPEEEEKWTRVEKTVALMYLAYDHLPDKLHIVPAVASYSVRPCPFLSLLGTLLM